MVSCKLKRKRIGFFVILTCFVMGCAPSTLYQWGEYENYLYKRYNKPGSVSAQEEIIQIENQLEQTYSNDRMPPPGLHAHLGYLYISDGQSSRALEQFNAEKKLFPESKKFIDGLIKRMKK